MKKYLYVFIGILGIIILTGACILLGKQGTWEKTMSAEELVEDGFGEAGITDYEQIDLTGYEERTGVVLADFICYRFFYESDGLQIEGFLSAPRELLETGEELPCVFFEHGGNRDYGALEPLEICYYAYQLDTLCIASNYRGCGRSEGQDEFGGADVRDVVRLLDICEEFGYIDAGRMNLMGVSRGGMMVYEVLREDSRIQKAVVVAGLADCFMSYGEREDMRQVFTELVGGSPEELPGEYEKRSATCWAEELDTPLLIFHTTGDVKVPLEQAEALVEKLQEYKKDYEFITFDSDQHADLRKEDIERIRAWLDIGGK